METRDYLIHKGWSFKQVGSQCRVQVCPLCGDKKGHFYMHAEKGLWDCKKCLENGNLFQLQLKLGDIKRRSTPVTIEEKKSEGHASLDSGKCLAYHHALLADRTAMEYLQEGRGLTEETIKHFKLGVAMRGSTKSLTIPHFSDGSLINIKYRSLPPAEKGFHREDGRPSILFNEDCLQENPDELFITEGETDAMSLWQAGFKNVVGVTAGAGSFPDEWLKKLEGIGRIYLCYDNDVAGQKGASSTAQKLGFARCKNVLLPQEQDANDYFKDNSPDDFKKLQGEAKRFSIPSIISVHDLIGRLIEAPHSNQQQEGIKTEWENVNKLIPSYQPGELIVLTAVPKTGKTTFALNIAYFNAINDIPCLFYCVEMSPERLLMKILSIKLGKSISQLDNDMMKEVRTILPNLPLYFCHYYTKIELNFVIETIRDAVGAYGIKFVVFDNLHFLVRSITHVTQELGLASKEFKLLAEELRIPIMLITQPRKSNPDEMIGMEDIRDSSLIQADADHIMIMFRGRQRSNVDDHEPCNSAFFPETVIRVEASRFNAGGDTTLYFEGAISKFRNIVAQDIKEFN